MGHRSSIFGFQICVGIWETGAFQFLRLDWILPDVTVVVERKYNQKGKFVNAHLEMVGRHTRNCALCPWLDRAPHPLVSREPPRTRSRVRWW